MAEPIIKLQPDGHASILSYDVPEPTSYTGRNLIELRLNNEVADSAAAADGKGYFKPHYYQLDYWQQQRSARDDAQLTTEVTKALRTGFFPLRYFPNVRIRTNALATHANDVSSGGGVVHVANNSLVSTV